jgi:SAM-dependent methyltransferase
MDQSLFATPRHNVKQEDCFFYHVCDVPGVGVVGGHWDLRSNVNDYLGRFDFAGKSVLDVGTASGFLTFEMEKRGGEIVSFDVAGARLTQIVPYHNDRSTMEELIASQEIGFDRLKNSYWFCHQRFRSSARAYYGDIHRLPASLGPFDVIMIGMCLPHIRDPLGALQSVAAKSRDTVIITQPSLSEDRPIMQMIPYPDLPDVEHIRYAWWTLSDGCITNFMKIMGFGLAEKYRASYRCCAYAPERWEDCTTFIFQRL